MAKKKNRELESEDSPSASQNTVFIDTNLDTHLALIVSDTDTVSDLKKKIIYEHPQCFPNFGELKIDALKVKRKGIFYHLSDSMLVRSAFEGVTKSWFLLVDAACLKQRDEIRSSTSADISNQLPLLCYTETSPGDMDNNISDTPSQKSSHLGAALMPQPVSQAFQFMGHKVTSTNHSGLGGSFKEVSDNVEIGDAHVSGYPLEGLPSNSNGRSNVDVGHDRQNEDTDHEPSPEGSLTVQPLSKKKNGSKKKRKDIVSNPIVKDNVVTTIVSELAASHPQVVGRQLTPDNSHEEVLNGMDIDGVNPFETSDTNRKLDSGDVPGKLEEHIGDKNRNFVGDDELLNNHPLEEAPKVDQSTKRKRKRKDEIQENGTFLQSFSKETPKIQAANPENKLKINEPLEDLVANGSSSGRKNKKKQKLSREQIGNADPFSLNNGGEQSKEEIAEVSAKNSAAATGAIVSEQDTQPPTLSRPINDSQKQKQREAVPKAVEEHSLPSLTGIGISVPDPTVADGKKDAPEARDRNRSKREKRSKKHHSANANEAPPPVFSELIKEKSGLVSAEKKISGPGHQKFDESDPELEEKRNIVNNGDPNEIQTENQGKPDTPTEAATAPSAKLVETNNVIKSGKSSGKRIKRKAKKSTAPKLVESGMEHADNFDGVVSPIARNSTSIDHQTVEGQKEESILSQTERTKDEAMHTSFLGDNTKGDDMSGNKAESSPEAHDSKIQETVGTMDKNLKKGTKRNQSSDANAVMTSPAEEQAEEPFQPNKINMTREDTENRSGKSKKKTRKGQNVGVKTDVFVGDNEKGGDMSGKQGASLPVAPANVAQETMENMDGNSRKRTKKNISSDKRTSTSFVSEERKNELESDQLNQINIVEKDAQTTIGKSKRKTRKNQESGAKGLPDVPIQEQKVSNGELAYSNGRPREVEKTEKKTKHAKRSLKDQLVDQEVELHGSGVEPVTSQSKANATADLEHVPSPNTPEFNSLGKRLQFDTAPSSDVEVPKSGTEGVNFKDYFVPVEQKHEVGPVDLGHKLTKVGQSDGEKSKKKGKNPGIPSLVESSNLPNSAKSVLVHGSKTKSHSKPSHTLENEVDPLDSHVIKPLKGMPEKERHPDIVNDPKIVSSVPAAPGASSSTSESSSKFLKKKEETERRPSLDKHRARVSKGSGKKTGDGFNSSGRHQSLLATPAAIFKDSSSESSEGHFGPVDSDASTRAPSDSSSSSADSEVESKSGRNGLYNATQDSGGVGIGKSQSAEREHVSMNEILRSSSRFKKAKLTATQSQLEDTESQPVEFVPETQPLE